MTIGDVQEKFSSQYALQSAFDQKKVRTCGVLTTSFKSSLYSTLLAILNSTTFLDQRDRETNQKIL